MVRNRGNRKVVNLLEELTELSRAQVTPGIKSPDQDELKRRRLGCRREKFKAFPPLIIRGNVRSLVDKTDELGALMRTQQEYQAETWLQEQL